MSTLNIKIDDSFCRDDYMSDDCEEVPKKSQIEQTQEPESGSDPESEPDTSNFKIIKTNTLLYYQHEYEYYPNGSLKCEKMVDSRTNKECGPFKEYYPTGVLFCEGYMDNGIIVNEVKTYYPSGSIAVHQEYDDGYLNGKSILYYESGRIAQKLNYRLVMATCDNKYKDYVSLIDGVYHEFNEDETLKTHVVYKMGCISEIKYCCDSSYIIPTTNYTICM